MNIKSELEKIFANLTPFLIGGIAIASLIGMLIMFSYILVWGLLIGGALWLIFVIKQLLFPSTTKIVIKKDDGRIIEYEDKK